MANLADGTLEDDVIECNFHFGAFHVPTGKVVQPPCFIPIKDRQGRGLATARSMSTATRPPSTAEG